MILGWFIGAGFVSGREIANYFSIFGKSSFISIYIAGILLFIFIYMFFRLSQKIQGFSNFVLKYFGKFGICINWLLVISLLILTSSMLAGSVVIAETIKINKFIFVIMTSFLCYIAVIGNIKALSKINLILVPIIIIVILTMCWGYADTKIQNGDIMLSIISGTNYVFINIVSLGLFILEVGKNYSRKECLIASILSTLIICLLIFVCNNAIITNNLTNYPMPLLTLSLQKNLICWIVSIVTIWSGLFTTITSSVFVLGNYINKYIKNYNITVILILFVSFLIGNLKFAFIVNYIYFIIGILGFIIISGVFIQEKKLFYLKKSFSCSKDIKN